MACLYETALTKPQIVIAEYCRRQISFAQDRLLALAGIAKIFARATGFTWSAGLWREHMPLALLWHADPSDESYAKYGFPSWSWAAAGKPLLLDFRRHYEGARIVAEVIDVKCVTVTEDPFSTLSDARLLLRASTVPLAIHTGSGKLALRLRETFLYPEIMHLDRNDKVYGLRPLLRARGAPDTTFERVITLPSTNEDNLWFSEPASVAAIIYSHAHRPTQSTTVFAIGGLFLEPIHCATGGAAKPTYRRFGMFTHRGWEVPSPSLPLHRDLISISEYPFRSDVQTHAPFDFDTSTCLEEMIIV